MTGRIALITGASEGIGAELARIFAANGHRVALVARREEKLRELAAALVVAGASLRWSSPAISAIRGLAT